MRDMTSESASVRLGLSIMWCPREGAARSFELSRSKRRRCKCTMGYIVAHEREALGSLVTSLRLAVRLNRKLKIDVGEDEQRRSPGARVLLSS